MINIDYINQNDTYIVNERRIKVNTLVSDQAISGFNARFAVTIDRIASNGLADITFGFEDSLYEWRKDLINSTDINTLITESIIPHNVVKLIRDSIIKHSLDVHASVYINKKLFVEFSTYNGTFKKQIKRVPYSTLNQKFSDIDNIVIQFWTEKAFSDKRTLLKEYQLILEKDKNEKIVINPYSNTAKLKVPYSYNINFESNKKYWKELYYHNIILNFEQLDNKGYHSNIISGYEYNDKKLLRFPGELNFNEYIPITFDSILLSQFNSEKIKLSTQNEYKNNIMLNNDIYYKTGIAYNAHLGELLYTNEVEQTITKSNLSQGSYAIKIPYKYDGTIDAIYDIDYAYGKIQAIKKFNVVGTNEHDEQFNKKLKIIEIEPQKEIKYKYLINLEADYINVLSDEFKIQDYLLIEENKKRKLLN
ncbi:MHO_1580 family protein [Mycoplasma sp. SK341A]|uniref:MHO_1580 family protein n=1 Tax=unclassified Mycoplasma TaxID=2683645 RepID=UPI003AB012E9